MYSQGNIAECSLTLKEIMPMRWVNFDYNEEYFSPYLIAEKKKDIATLSSHFVKATSLSHEKGSVFVYALDKNGESVTLLFRIIGLDDETCMIELMLYKGVTILPIKLLSKDLLDKQFKDICYSVSEVIRSISNSTDLLTNKLSN